MVSLIAAARPPMVILALRPEIKPWNNWILKGVSGSAPLNNSAWLLRYSCRIHSIMLRDKAAEKNAVRKMSTIMQRVALRYFARMINFGITRYITE
ncbi:hypothetical protein GCM10022246_01440 [Pedobacter ginsengiterrae]|uniref:Uncharacterized protein n=1 Tax=Pedobacter ginsengiterrae TaxID=871696 RepID=A0ABP7NPE0_9SPHI